jgi:hypothetical protein
MLIATDIPEVEYTDAEIFTTFRCRIDTSIVDNHISSAKVS